MNRPTRLVGEVQQSYSFSRRAVVLGAAQGAVALALGARMTWLAVIENQRYQLLAESNRVNLTMIPPRRGWIIDRYGHPIANNRTDFRVDIIPDRLPKDDADRVIKLLQQLLTLPP
ncbi:MAG: penicillin-binding protein 2, partial [Sphingomonas sp.]